MQHLIQKLARIVASALLLVGFLMPLAVSGPAWAAAEEPCTPDTTGTKSSQTNVCPGNDTAGSDTVKCTDVNDCDVIKKYINPAVNFLAALFGLIVMISIVIGGIQYSTSAGDPQKASAARARIRNAIIALIAFILLYAGLNFLLPGGLV